MYSLLNDRQAWVYSVSILDLLLRIKSGRYGHNESEYGD